MLGLEAFLLVCGLTGIILANHDSVGFNFTLVRSARDESSRKTNSTLVQVRMFLFIFDAMSSAFVFECVHVLLVIWKSVNVDESENTCFCCGGCS